MQGGRVIVSEGTEGLGRRTLCEVSLIHPAIRSLWYGSCRSGRRGVEWQWERCKCKWEACKWSGGQCDALRQCAGFLESRRTRDVCFLSLSLSLSSAGLALLSDWDAERIAGVHVLLVFLPILHLRNSFEKLQILASDALRQGLAHFISQTHFTSCLLFPSFSSFASLVSQTRLNLPFDSSVERCSWLNPEMRWL